MKRYLLITGQDYYASAGTGNWIDTFDSEDEAIEFLKSKCYEWRVDWFEVVDLHNWKPLADRWSRPTQRIESIKPDDHSGRWFTY